MPRDGAGNFTLAPGNPVVPGTVIEAAWANPTLSDIAANITDSLSRTGQGGMLVPFRNTDGVVGAPGMTWANEPSSGWYRAGLNDFWYSVGNENIFRIQKTGISLAAGKTFTGFASTTINVASGVLIASTPGITLTQTWNNAAVQFIGADMNITDTASLASSLLQRWQVGGVEMASIRKDGLITATNLHATGNAARVFEAWGPTVSGAIKLGDSGYLTAATGAAAGQTYLTANLYYDGVAWKVKRAGGGAVMVVNADQQVFIFNTAPIAAAGASVALVEQVRIVNIDNAVNRIQMQGSVTAGSAAIYMAGTDADAGFGMFSKGTGQVTIGSLTNGTVAAFIPVAGGTRGFTFTNSVANDPVLGTTAGNISCQSGRSLIINGNVVFQSQDGAGVIAFSGFVPGGVARWGTFSNHPTVFMVNNSEYARINTAGFFKAANPSGAVSGVLTSAYHEFCSQLANDGNGTLRVANIAGAGVRHCMLMVYSPGPNDTTSFYIQGVDELAVRFQMRSNGGLANVQANNVNLSDMTVKTGYTPVTPDHMAQLWDAHKKINWGHYKYAGQTHDDPNFGYTAQGIASAFQTAAPWLVDEWHDPKTPGLLAVYSTDLHNITGAIVSELQRRVEALEAKP